MVHNVAPNEDPRNDFGMKRASVDRDPLRRIVREAVKQRRFLDRERGTVHSQNDIIMPVKTVLLNSKEEFYLPRIIGLTDQRTE